jgi:shikimate kinase
MSGTGKSSVIRELSRLGLRAIDTDWDPEWERPTAEGEWIWREDRIQGHRRLTAKMTAKPANSSGRTRTIADGNTP